MQRESTEAVRRALETAAGIARQWSAAEILPLDLLCALLADESHAAEILADHAITAESLAVRFPQAGEAIAAARSKPDGSGPADVELPTAGETVRHIVAEARRQAGLLGRHAEVGSEHLLVAMTVVDSPLAEFLRGKGLSAETLAGPMQDATGTTSEPIDVDVRIAWRERTESDRTDLLRILDAAANRAREGLRVVEDFVRFTLDDAHLTGLLKGCRHELSQQLRSLGETGLLAARETRRDVGTKLSTGSERERSAPLDVVRAAFKRTQEALRTLEEYGKVVAADWADVLERLRYETYTLEKAVLATHDGRRRFENRMLYLLVTESLCHHGSGPAVRAALAGGAGVVQVREKEMPERPLIEQARRVRRWTSEAGALFIMNDRPDLAVIAEADGVHVGQEEISVREARRIVGPDRLVGVSTHDIEQARQAVLDGADYLGVGPVFASRTKDFAAGELAGLEFVRQAAAEITLPWFAIGGITAENITAVLDAGATRVAVSGAICSVADPGEATARLMDALRQP